jgi:hypothetical protein
VNQTVVDQNLDSFQWNYYYVDITSAASALVMNFERTGGSGDPDFYVKFGGVPSLRDYDYRDIACDPCGVTSHTISIPQASVRVGRYYIGAFGYCCDSAQYSAVVMSARLCTPECMNDGVCDYDRGVCQCVGGFSGVDCSIPTGSVSIGLALGIAGAVLGVGIVVFLLLFFRNRIFPMPPAAQTFHPLDGTDAAAPNVLPVHPQMAFPVGPVVPREAGFGGDVSPQAPSVQDREQV